MDRPRSPLTGASLSPEEVRAALQEDGAARRAKLRRLIHVARRELRLDDDAYRLMLKEVTGQTSTKELSFPQLDAVVRRMRKSGFKVRYKKPDGTKSSALDVDAMAQKVRALWLTLADAGVIRDRSEAALSAWVLREFQVEALQWLTGEQLTRAIERLKKWQKRSKAPSPAIAGEGGGGG